MTIPRPVQQTLNARALDAFDAFKQAVRDGDREAARRQLRLLEEYFDDEEALAKEFGS